MWHRHIHRTYIPGGTYFVTTYIRRRTEYFCQTDITKIAQANTWNAVTLQGCVLFASVFMPNHLHDTEWGVPQHDDQKLFEFLALETFQAGLSWMIVLRKREALRKAFANFNPRLVAQFDKRKIERLMKNAAIIRNGSKIRAAVNNARCFLAVQKEFGSFDKYIWSFVQNKPIRHRNRTEQDFVARSALSDRLSEDMGKHGFTFRGSTICYAFMQATGMINDHLVNCFRFKEVARK